MALLLFAATTLASGHRTLVSEHGTERAQENVTHDPYEEAQILSPDMFDDEDDLDDFGDLDLNEFLEPENEFLEPEPAKNRSPEYASMLTPFLEFTQQYRSSAKSFPAMLEPKGQVVGDVVFDIVPNENKLEQCSLLIAGEPSKSLEAGKLMDIKGGSPKKGMASISEKRKKDSTYYTFLKKTPYDKDEGNGDLRERVPTRYFDVHYGNCRRNTGATGKGHGQDMVKEQKCGKLAAFARCHSPVYGTLESCRFFMPDQRGAVAHMKATSITPSHRYRLTVTPHGDAVMMAQLVCYVDWLRHKKWHSKMNKRVRAQVLEQRRKKQAVLNA